MTAAPPACGAVAADVRFAAFRDDGVVRFRDRRLGGRRGRKPGGDLRAAHDVPEAARALALRLPRALRGRSRAPRRMRGAGRSAGCADRRRRAGSPQACHWRDAIAGVSIAGHRRGGAATSSAWNRCERSRSSCLARGSRAFGRWSADDRDPGGCRGARGQWRASPDAVARHPDSRRCRRGGGGKPRPMASPLGFIICRRRSRGSPSPPAPARRPAPNGTPRPTRTPLRSRDVARALSPLGRERPRLRLREGLRAPGEDGRDARGTRRALRSRLYPARPPMLPRERALGGEVQAALRALAARTQGISRDATTHDRPHDYIRDGAEIYRRSFAIIRREADLARFTPEEEQVAVRIIHACGMVEAAADIALLARRARRRARRCGPARRSSATPRWSRTASRAPACPPTTT